MIFNVIFSVCMVLQAIAIVGLSAKIDMANSKTYFDGVNDGIGTVLRLLTVMGESFKESGKDDEADCDQ